MFRSSPVNQPEILIVASNLSLQTSHRPCFHSSKSAVKNCSFVDCTSGCLDGLLCLNVGFNSFIMGRNSLVTCSSTRASGGAISCNPISTLNVRNASKPNGFWGKHYVPAAKDCVDKHPQYILIVSSDHGHDEGLLPHHHFYFSPLYSFLSSIHVTISMESSNPCAPNVSLLSPLSSVLHFLLYCAPLSCQFTLLLLPENNCWFAGCE